LNPNPNHNFHYKLPNLKLESQAAKNPLKREVPMWHECVMRYTCAIFTSYPILHGKLLYLP